MSKARVEITAALLEAQEAYQVNGKKPFDAGYFEGLKAALEILDKCEFQDGLVAGMVANLNEATRRKRDGTS